MGRKRPASSEGRAEQHVGWLRDLWERFANPRLGVWGGSESRRLARLVESLKKFLALLLLSIVRATTEQDVLVEEYSSDCTPMSTVHRLQFTLEDELTKRSGHSGKDFLCERYFVKVAKRGSRPARIAFRTRDPVPMTEGKTALAHFACFKSFGDTARQMKFQGLNIAAGKWDRAVYGPCKRLAFAWHRKVHADLQIEEWRREKLWMLFWLMCIPCSAHDAHNALKWGLYSRLRRARWGR